MESKEIQRYKGMLNTVIKRLAQEEEIVKELRRKRNYLVDTLIGIYLEEDEINE